MEEATGRYERALAIGAQADDDGMVPLATSALRRIVATSP
jgi:hypothetical protein